MNEEEKHEIDNANSSGVLRKLTFGIPPYFDPTIFYICSCLQVFFFCLIPELEKAAHDACGHFTENHALLRTFGPKITHFCRDFGAGIEDRKFKIED